MFALSNISGVVLLATYFLFDPNFTFFEHYLNDFPLKNFPASFPVCELNDD